jgi:spore coat protein CotH
MKARALGPLVLVLTVGAAPARATDPVFNQSILHETRIVMDPADWQALRDNFRSNQYYAANVSIDGEVIQQVGIRSRGKGSRSGTKPGIQVDVNKYVSGQEFHGYKSIVVDNLVQDPSFLREPLSFAVFEAMGMAAPQIAYTRLTVNDQYWGLYTLVEDVTKPFLEARLGDKEGNLYKYEYLDAYDFTYKGADAKSYVPVPFEPKTNEDHLDTTGLVSFIRTMNEAPDEGYAATMSAFLDTRAFLAYVAVENAIAENDGFVGYAGMNNYYLYQYAGGNRFVFIPWDKDTTFTDATWPLFQRMDTNVLTRRLIADPEQGQAYVAAAAQAAGFVSEGFLVPRLEALYAVLRNAALEDTHKPQSNDEFELAVNGLRAIVAARQGDIMGQVQAASRLGVRLR